MSPIIESKNIQRGKYLRECDTAMKNKQYFAKKADEERELRLMLREPKNWFSTYFSFSHEKEEISALVIALVNHLYREGYDVAVIEDWAAQL